GNSNPATDPVWSVGWDTKSILLAVRMPKSGWSFYRLPKASHSYDGAHGWNTEWPRIRDIGEDKLLMTMHGTFWEFPKTFTPENSAGIAPRSNYLKVIGDFCRWNDRLVFGCDDVAMREFQNRRRAKGEIAATQSHSNLWFVEPERLDELGPAIGRGLVWEHEDVPAKTASDPFLFLGYDVRCLHLSHTGDKPVSVFIEVDRNGDGNWTKLHEVQADNYSFVKFSPEDAGTWVRLTCKQPAKSITAAFSYHARDTRPDESAAMFEGLARPGQTRTAGVVRARGKEKRTLAFVATNDKGEDLGLYELDGELNLKLNHEAGLLEWTQENAAIPKGILEIDEASVLFVDDKGNRWRLPKGDAAFDNYPGEYRVDREIVTERDLLNAHGTFYELPSPNSGGFIKIRPVATHNRMIHDYCGYRGLIVVSGVAVEAGEDNPHILKSNDGKAALWAGTIDDLWQFGKPRGNGGPWKNNSVKANEPSDPYLMTAYDLKTMTLSASEDTSIRVEVDITGNGDWATYKTFEMSAGKEVTHEFPAEFSAYWVRVQSSNACTATAQLEYK
ncbi:MAG: hypothetical protein AAF394_11165, partial [Planctomycetota bacterium]